MKLSVLLAESSILLLENYEKEWVRYFRNGGFQDTHRTLHFSSADKMGIDLFYGGGKKLQIKSSIKYGIKHVATYIFQVSQLQINAQFVPLVIGPPPGSIEARTLDTILQRDKCWVNSVSVDIRQPEQISSLVDLAKNAERLAVTLRENPSKFYYDLIDLLPHNFIIDLMEGFPEHSNKYMEIKERHDSASQASANTRGSIQKVSRKDLQILQGKPADVPWATWLAASPRQKATMRAKASARLPVQPEPTPQLAPPMNPAAQTTALEGHEFRAGRGHPPKDRLNWKCIKCGGQLRDPVHTNIDAVLDRFKGH